MDMNDYLSKCKDMIANNTKTYGSIEENALTHFSSAFNAVLKQLHKKGLISLDMYKACRCSAPAFALLYGLPKVHKITDLKHLDRKLILSQLKLRPIISACGFVTYCLQQRLVPILKLLESHDSSSTVLNVFEFIERVREKHLLPSSALVSFDVESMFTSGPVDECLEAITNRLTELEPTILKEHGLAARTVVRLLRLCGTVLFRVPSGECYEQLWGFPMGGPISPLVCSYFIHLVELKALDTWKGERPAWWLRYVDDTSAAFPRDAVPSFLVHLNATHDSIKWTVEVERDNRISFLDCLVLRAGEKLKFTLFRKPTATSRYIDSTSCHSAQHKRSWITSMLYRIDRISDPEFRDGLRDQLMQMGKINGYSRAFLTSCFRMHDQRHPPPKPSPPSEKPSLSPSPSSSPPSSLFSLPSPVTSSSSLCSSLSPPICVHPRTSPC